MDKKTKPSNIFIYVIISIVSLSIVIFLLLTNLKTDNILASFKQHAKEVKALPESDNHHFVQQITELKNQLELCNSERERLKYDSTKIALVMADTYRLLVTEILSLNEAFQSEQDLEAILSKVRLHIKKPSIENANLQEYFTILENYNIKYNKARPENQKINIGKGWLNRFLDKWIVIERQDKNFKDKLEHYHHASKALQELNAFIASPNFLKVFIGS
jgi:hypothetical protein